jgi:hypothetical protein
MPPDWQLLSEMGVTGHVLVVSGLNVISVLITH